MDDEAIGIRQLDYLIPVSMEWSSEAGGGTEEREGVEKYGTPGQAIVFYDTRQGRQDRAR